MTQDPPPPARSGLKTWRQTTGAASRRRGMGAEWQAAAWLMLHGYQILGFRLKPRANSGLGEIDILARRGKILAVVEVKRRVTMETALSAVTPKQHQRLLASGRALLHGRPSLAGHDLRIDVVALAPGRFPRHIRGLNSTLD